MEPLLLSAGVGLESFNVPVIVAMVAAPVALIIGIIWLALSVKKTNSQK